MQNIKYSTKYNATTGRLTACLYMVNIPVHNEEHAGLLLALNSVCQLTTGLHI